MKWTATEKRQLTIFGLVAFALPYLLGILMGISYHAGNDVSVFTNAQMFYPAAGVMLAMLLTRKGDSLLPKKFYGCFLALTGVMLACAIASVVLPALPWAGISNLVIMGGTLVVWAGYFADGKARRAAYSLRLTKTGGSNVFLMVLLFIVLYFARIFLASGLTVLLDPSQAAGAAGEALDPLFFAINLIAMPLNFLLVFTAFFGEEYGWRGFFQPLLQKRFGLRGGVLVLGVMWGLWHLPINIFFYSPDTWGLSVLNQIVVCICYSVFFGFAYMKTKSIWAPVMIHFFNNNAIVLFASPDSIQNQVLTWTGVLAVAVVMFALHLPFLASKVFSTGSTEPLPRPTQQPEENVQ